MDKTKDGGPAFPFPVMHGRNCPEGMSLRDYFAAKALAGVPQPLNSLNDIDAAYQRIAEHCYHMADAMLAVREKGGA